MAVRKLKVYIFATIVTSCVAIIFSGISLGTKEWYSGSIQINDVKIEISYGLFKGSKTKSSGADTDKYPLVVTCAEGVCMYSCGSNSDKRAENIKALLENNGVAEDSTYCLEDSRTPSKQQHSRDPRANKNNVEGFLNFGYWLSTVVFIGIGIFFSGLSGALALYNTLQAPIQPILSIFGLYIWNGAAALSILLSMVLWGCSFGVDLKKSAAVSESISGKLDGGNPKPESDGSLGYSYWILLLPVIIGLANMGMLKYRSYKIATADQKITQVIDDKLTSGDNLLF